MPDSSPVAAMIGLIRDTVRRECLHSLVLSKPLEKSAPTRISCRLSARRGKRVLFCEEAYPGGRVSQFSVPEDGLADALPARFSLYGAVTLSTPLGDATLLRSARGTETLRGEATLRRALSAAESGSPAAPGSPGALLSELTPLSREPKRILSGDEPFLSALGISDARGRVHDKRQAKFRQINRFLEFVGDIYNRLPREGTILVYDLCCGKSYLSFALYHELAVRRGRRVAMLGMDRKEDVMSFCTETAKAAGFSEVSDEPGTTGMPGWHGMRFLAGDIRTLPRNASPDLVVSLHACDIATDLVLDTAVSLGTRVILSTPCCHRYLDSRLDSPALAFLTRYPKLRGKLAEAATDALRAALLEASGYEVTVAELVDPDDTPKNTLLRAVLRANWVPGSPGAEAKRAEYDAALRFLLGDGATDYLADVTGGSPND